MRLRQTLVVLLGLGLAAAMAVLGVWQLDVYHSQGAETAAARAAAAPLELRTVAPAGAAITEGFGRSVRVRGRYDPALQVLVGSDSGPYRVLSGLVQDDGSVVPVVRGTVGTGQKTPPPPSGPVDEVGVLLPSQDDAPRGTPGGPGRLDAVQLPVLAQQWPGPLVAGYVTLSAADARSQGLPPASLALPEARGRLRNAAYAFQWWVFGAFTVFLATRMARDLDRRDDDEERPDEVGVVPVSR